MSLTDPEQTKRRIQAALRPFVVITSIIGLGSAVVIALVMWANGSPAEGDGIAIFLYVGISVAAGLFAYYTVKHRNALGISAYCVAYGGGLVLVLASTSPVDDTTATVTSVGVDGMVNYVQHQKITLTFTDQQGRQRWFTIGRTGGGYGVGDRVSIRYDPDHPGEKRAIVVTQ